MPLEDSDTDVTVTNRTAAAGETVRLPRVVTAHATDGSREADFTGHDRATVVSARHVRSSRSMRNPSFGAHFQYQMEAIRAGEAWALDRLIAWVAAGNEPTGGGNDLSPVDLLPTRWGSQPYPPNGYLSRGARGVTVARGYPENERGFDLVRQIQAAAQKAGASWVHSNIDGSRTVVYYHDTKLFFDEDDASPVDLGVTVSEVYAPMFANLGSPTGLSVFVNGLNPPQGIRSNASPSTALEGFAANFEKPDTGFTLTQGAGGSLADGTYIVRIAQVEVDTVTGTIISAPSETKSIAIAAGGGTAKITVAQAAWVPSTRATHWRIGVTAVGGTDAPANYFWSGSDIVIATTSSDITAVNAGGVYTSTPPFESRNGFYKTTDLTEIIASKHPRGIIAYEGRFIVWYKNDARILWSERDEWGWYSTNSLDTGAEGGWNLPVRSLVGFRGHLLVFTEAAVHAVFGDFARDLDGAFPTYAANAYPKTLLPGVGTIGGPLSAKVGSDGRVYFISTSGPAVFDGTLNLLAPDDIRLDWHNLDKSGNYPDRWMIEEDPQTGSIWFGMTRKTNASRPMDGASVAGIVDTFWRWLPTRGFWDVPYQQDLVHIIARTNGAEAASQVGPTLLMGVNHMGGVVQLGAWAGLTGGVSDGVVSSADYDGILASANNTTTATIALAGISADALIGLTVTLRYPSADSTYPYRVVQKTIIDNTATTGGNVTITWSGAVTAPSTSFWTVRIAGMLCRLRGPLDPRGLPVAGATPASYYKLDQLEWRFKDKVGAESIA